MAWCLGEIPDAFPERGGRTGHETPPLRPFSAATMRKLSIPLVVFVVLATLKLAGVSPVVGWSWVWVTLPLWLGAGGVLAFLTIIGAVGLICGVVAATFGRGP